MTESRLEPTLLITRAWAHHQFFPQELRLMPGVHGAMDPDVGAQWRTVGEALTQALEALEAVLTRHEAARVLTYLCGREIAMNIAQTAEADGDGVGVAKQWRVLWLRRDHLATFLQGLDEQLSAWPWEEEAEHAEGEGCHVAVYPSTADVSPA